MNVLITGGAGFIGFHLARFHAERGDHVHLIDNLFKTQGRLDPDFDRLKALPNVSSHLVDLTGSLAQFGRTNSIPTTVIRYHNIYGARMGYRHVIPEFILRAHRRESPFAIYGGGETRAFCHVDDAVRATHVVAVTPETNQEIVHIGN